MAIKRLSKPYEMKRITSSLKAKALIEKFPTWEYHVPMQGHLRDVFQVEVISLFELGNEDKLEGVYIFRVTGRLVVKTVSGAWYEVADPMLKNFDLNELDIEGPKDDNKDRYREYLKNHTVES